jgi:hypothetical protein
MQVATNLTTQDLLLSLTSTTIHTIIQSNNNYNNNRSNYTTVNISSTEITPNIQLSHSALGIFLSIFCFITVFGNGLVIYAIVQERYLKSGTDLFYKISHLETTHVKSLLLT